VFWHLIGQGGLGFWWTFTAPYFLLAWSVYIVTNRAEALLFLVLFVGIVHVLVTMFLVHVLVLLLYRPCTRHYVPRPCTRIVCWYRPCTRHYVPRPCTRIVTLSSMYSSLCSSSMYSYCYSIVHVLVTMFLVHVLVLSRHYSLHSCSLTDARRACFHEKISRCRLFW
jgi:hypothetical protein